MKILMLNGDDTVLSSLTERELAQLRWCITQEEHVRVTKECEDGRWPVPKLTGNTMMDLKTYREEQGIESLLKAKYIVDYYNKLQHDMFKGEQHA